MVGTVRKKEAVRDFEGLQLGAAFARVLDLAHAPEKLAAIVEEVERNVGSIYALINNAEYGHEGTLEESSIDELRQQFELNVFGAVAMIKAVLPHMRLMLFSPWFLFALLFEPSGPGAAGRART